MLRFKGFLFPIGSLLSATRSERDGVPFLTLLWKLMAPGSLKAFGVAPNLPPELTGDDALNIWNALLESLSFVQISDILINQQHVASWLPHEKDGQFALTISLRLTGAPNSNDPQLTFFGEDAKKLKKAIGNRPMMKTPQSFSNRKSRFLQ